MAVVPIPVNSYTGIFVVTLLFAFLDGYSIGANDVANSFATSVGSRSLTYTQAVCIALFTEFGGAVLLGASNASTIKDNIVRASYFEKRQDLLMTGFMCALIASSLWIMGCIRIGMHPSTTHSIVCALVGVGVAAFGWDAVNWSWNGRGVGFIVAGWFLAPTLAAILAGTIYALTRWIVFSNPDKSLQRGIYAIPVYFTLTGFIVSFFVIMKNGKGDWGISVAGNNPGGSVTLTGDLGKAFTIIGSMTGVIFLFCVLFAVPFFQRRLIKEESLKWYHIFYIWFVPTQPRDENLAYTLNQAMTPHIKLDGVQTTDAVMEEKTEVAEVVEEKGHPAWIKFKNVALKGFYHDISADQYESAKHLHANVHLFDNKTEYLFSFLQVMTASFASFAHGSNDVANSVGPFAGVYSIWSEGKLSSSAKAPVPVWMLAFGGIAINLGLAFYGYNIMRNLGNNLTYHSPSRGFAMELGAALTVITSAFLALPVSTSQCIVGATLGVGFVGGNSKAINWKMFGWIALSWALTLPVASGAAGLLFYVLTNMPSFTTIPVAPK
ncbi:phosphate transporter [Rhizoclosmatium globosum]|uniref:Phosphate transporter n=1 Tax=Rhizoclosmatium globosum TaxID=329046 RepID=A0A1Y2BMP8_9FUNG|nr:phosphate transporter [Rhizoclosmatium globosum]|eukprot:ORY35970.1 phosphate transporter [Rhizoclosmatium globosum]